MLKTLSLMGLSAVIAEAYRSEDNPFEPVQIRPYVSLIPLLVTIPCVWFVYRVFIYPFFVSPFRHLPEPSSKYARFPWAHAYTIMRQPNGSAFRTWIHEVQNHGMIRLRVLFNKEMILLTSPEAIREVIVTNEKIWVKTEQAAYLLRQILGNGLVVASGDDHTHQRKALMPAFSFRHIKDLYPVLYAKGRESALTIAAAVKKTQQPQKVHSWANRVTLDIIGCAAMGYDFNSLQEQDSDFVTTYRNLFDSEPPYYLWRLTGVWLPLGLIFSLPFPKNKRLRAAAAKLRSLCLDMVRKRREAIEKAESTDVDVLSVILRSSVFPTDEDVANQLTTFLAAGHDTTASSLTLGIYLLCKHPEVQKRLREEIREHLPSLDDLNASVTADKFDQMPYMRAVCNEMLRLAPAIPSTCRDATHATTIQGQYVPKGTRIVASAWATNTSPELWGEDALEFKPERWLAEGQANAGGAKSNYAFLTFIHGPHSCIGQGFAKAELVCILAAWIGRFEIRLEDENLPYHQTTWVTARAPPNGIPAIFTEVEGW